MDTNAPFIPAASQWNPLHLLLCLSVIRQRPRGNVGILDHRDDGVGDPLVEGLLIDQGIPLRWDDWGCWGPRTSSGKARFPMQKLWFVSRSANVRTCPTGGLNIFWSSSFFAVSTLFCLISFQKIIVNGFYRCANRYSHHKEVAPSLTIFFS